MEQETLLDAAFTGGAPPTTTRDRTDQWGGTPATAIRWYLSHLPAHRPDSTDPLVTVNVESVVPLSGRSRSTPSLWIEEAVIDGVAPGLPGWELRLKTPEPGDDAAQIEVEVRIDDDQCRASLAVQGRVDPSTRHQGHAPRSGAHLEDDRACVEAAVRAAWIDVDVNAWSGPAVRRWREAHCPELPWGVELR